MSAEPCDYCGSTNVRATVEPVQGRGDRAVMTCQSCGTSWINTEPTNTEQIVVALLAARKGTA